MKTNNHHRGIFDALAKPALALALYALAGLVVSAATITFNAPVAITGNTDVLPLGQGVNAYNFGSATTVNSVAFAHAASYSSFGNITLAGFNSYSANTFAGTAAPYLNLSAAYTNLLVGGVYITNGGFNTVGTVTFNGLYAGHNYAVQMWADDSRNLFLNRNEYIYDGSGGATNLLAYNAANANGGLGQYVTGYFTADATGSQSFFLNSGATNTFPQMNAVQLRDLSTVWSGTTSGAWADSDTTSANFSGSSYSTVLGTGLTNVYFGDADAFGNAVARTVITVGAGGASSLNVVFLNNAYAYTLNSADANGITGSVNVTLNGTNTVTFTGAHAYTGSTVLGNNARLAIGASGSIADSASVALGANGMLTCSNSSALSGAASITLSAGSVLDASSSSLPLSAGQTFSGTGTVKGNVTAAVGAAIIPGGVGLPGVLTFSNNLTLNGQTNVFDVGYGPNSPSDLMNVSGTLTLNGNGVISLNYLGGSLYGGTYTLVTYAAKSGGTFTLDHSYPGVTLNVNATSVTLTVTGVTGGTVGVWTNLSAGNWTTAANWQGSVIATNTDGLADFSTLLMTANNSVTVASTNLTIGHLAFGDVGQTYTLTLTAGTNRLAVSSGSPTISVSTNGPNVTAVINSVLAGSQGFTVLGAGQLNLGGVNQITNGVNVVGGAVLDITAAGALSRTTVSSLNPVILSNAFFAFSTPSPAQFFTNDLYLYGSNTIIQAASAQTTFVGKIVGTGIVNWNTPGSVVLCQHGDMSGFTGTNLVTGNASGGNAGGFLMGHQDSITGISGSANAVFDFEGNTLNYLYNASINATNYMGALMGNNTHVVLNAKNGSGTVTGNLTVEVGALNQSTAFAGIFKDYANANTSATPPQLGIRKVGTGNLTLSGANINTGPTEVRNGKLTITGSLVAPITVDSGAVCEVDGSISSASVTVNGGGTFLVGGGASLGSAAITVNGLLDVSAAGTGSSGTFSLGAASLSGSGVVTGAVTLASATVNPGPIGGAGALTITNGDFTVTGGTLNFDLSNEPTNGVNAQLFVNGNLNLNSAATLNINKLNGSLGGGTYRLILFSGSLNGSLANLTLTGADPLDVLQQNGNEIDLIASPFTTVIWTGGTAGNLWDITASTNWTLNTVKATFTNGEAVLFNNSGATNPVVTLPATVLPAAVSVNSSSNYTFTGAADIGGAASLTKSGAGTLTILNTNTYTANTFVNGGTLKLGDGTANNGSVPGNIVGSTNTTLVIANPVSQAFGGVISGPGVFIKQGVGALTLNATNALTGPTTISAGALILGDGSSQNGLLGTGTVTNNSQLLFAEINPATIANNLTGTGGIDNNSSASVSLSGVISGTCSLTNDVNAGTLFLLSSNSYSGGTWINNGTVILNDATLNGAGSGNIVIGDGSGTLSFNVGGSNVFANNIQLPADSATEQFSLWNLTLAAGSTVRLAGQITGGATNQITQFVNSPAAGNNRGVLILDNSSNTFTTIPEVDLGTLTFTSDGALGDYANTISVNEAANVNTRFYSSTIGGLQFGASNITLNASRAINLVGTENIDVQSYTGTIAGPVTGVGMVKLGSGTLILNGAGALADSTTVSAGTLVANNAWTCTNVTVNSGATLSGTGSISAPVLISSGGTLVLGTPATAILTVASDLLLNPGSTALMKLNAATVTCDRIAGIGTLTYAGTLAVTNLGGTFAAGQAYQLFSAASYTGSFAATNLPALGSGLAWNWNPALGALSVVSGIATNPTNITAKVIGGNLNLAWPADHTGWRLLVQTNGLSTGLGTNWFTWPNSTSVDSVSIPLVPGNPSVFFKLVYP